MPEVVMSVPAVVGNALLGLESWISIGDTGREGEPIVVVVAVVVSTAVVSTVVVSTVVVSTVVVLTVVVSPLCSSICEHALVVISQGSRFLPFPGAHVFSVLLLAELEILARSTNICSRRLHAFLTSLVAASRPVLTDVLPALCA